MDGVLSGPVDGPARVRAQYPEVEARPGLKVEHRGSRFGGVVLRVEKDGVLIRGRSGQDRLFRLAPGAFDVDRKAVTLVRPKAAAAGPTRTASGSVAVDTAARVARGSRILVEGIHDAELVEKVWGDDLRVEGVVVERLDGADHLADVVREFGPEPGRRLGVLLDHLVEGTKEARLAATVRHPHVLVTGHPYVDVWQGIRPKAAGIAAWPVVPMGQPWKEGVLAALGVPGEPGPFWKQLLGRVSSYADLEPPLVGAVEQLIDFVTEG
ncbi:MAG: hypothetical protein JWO68_2921 [Actinomycetia bacterium]|nr:hypothetical protein [Actinomycetes bacterium]